MQKDHWDRLNELFSQAVDLAPSERERFLLDSCGDDAWWGDDPESCEVIGSPCREYFPRIVGDIDGDGRADLLGFDRTNTVFQSMPYVTQFE